MRKIIEAVRHNFVRELPAAPALAGVQSIGPTTRDATPTRSVNRDRVLRPTSAPPAARQTWELYKARQESRDLELRTSIWGGYVRFARIQALGAEPATLLFEDMEPDAKKRLRMVLKWVRRKWGAYQRYRGISGDGRNVHQLAGSVLHHMLVDGDCFMTWRMVNGYRVWDLHPGDALAETSVRVGTGGMGERRLGVELDRYRKPIAYHFGQGGYVPHWTWGSAMASTKPRRVSAARVIHFRDMSGEATVARGWPRCTQVIDDIARLDEWFSAMIRGSITRAAISFALKKDTYSGSPAALGGDKHGAQGLAARSIGGTKGTGGEGMPGREDIRPYQEFEANAGGVVELDPGYEAQNLNPGSPTAQEGDSLQRLGNHVCGALRATPATLFGEYGGLSFSGGQLGHQQERQGIEDIQMMMTGQFYTPVYVNFLMARWVEMVRLFPEIDPETDLPALLYPTHKLRKYQVLDKGRLVTPMIKSWEAGILSWQEVRAELGLSGDNEEEVIEQIKEVRRMLGMAADLGGVLKTNKSDPEDDAEGGGESDPDKKEKDEED